MQMLANNRRRNRNWFTANSAIFEMENLTEHDIIVYLYLCRCVEGAGHSFPGREEISRACKVSVRTVDRALKNLEATKLIRKTLFREPIDEFRTFSVSWYEIFDPPEISPGNEPTTEKTPKNPSVPTRVKTFFNFFRGEVRYE